MSSSMLDEEDDEESEDDIEREIMKRAKGAEKDRKNNKQDIKGTGLP